jgi:hypothetical protein
MRTIFLVAGTAGLIGIFTACGGDARPKALGDEPTNQGGKGGSKPKPEPADGGENMGGSGNEVDPLAPVVKVTSPVAVEDPNEGPVVTGATVTVTCDVRESTAAGAGTLNTSTIKLSVVSEDGELVAEKPGVPTDTADEYSAEFPLTAVAAGRVGFGCQASDDEKRTGTSAILTFLDKGPKITLELPEADSAHALTDVLDLKFRVEPAPLAESDESAAVTSVKLSMGGEDISLDESEDPKEPGSYRLQVALNDASVFNPAPNGPFPLTIVAVNDRQPQRVAATLERSVAVDGEGPEISLTSPKDKDVVGGRVRLTFKATDAISGVDPETLVVTLNLEQHPFDETSENWTKNGTTYSYEFDSRNVDGSFVQITANVTAKDNVGNVSAGASAILYLDNYPPVVDMDPLNIRSTAQRKVPATDTLCSASFDPVGDGARDDLDQSGPGARFRALIVDQTNTLPQIEARFSKVNTGQVRLYTAEWDPENPLLVDKNEDGICDEVADIDSANSIALNPIPKAGTGLNGKDDAIAPSAASLSCKTSDPQSTPPPRLCSENDSDMWQVIQDDYNDIPVIYGVAVTTGKDCTGVGWEFGTKAAADGWICLVTRAVDNAGNVGVSRPLRVCVDSEKHEGSPPCATSSVDPPTCTKDCTPPSRLGGDLWQTK